MERKPRKAHNRGKGEGSIVKRSDGRYQGSYVHNGKRHYIYGRQRNEVRDRLATILHDIRGGTYVAPDRTTVAAFMARWLSEVKAPVLRPATMQSYGILIRVHIEPSDLGKMRLQDVTAQHVQAFLAGVRGVHGGEPLSPRTVQYLYSILRQAFGQAAKWSLIPRNVVLLVDPPRIMRHEAATLTTGQARALLRAVEGDRYYPLMVLALGTGMRRGELLALRWQDVDLERGTVTVRASLQRVGGELRRDTTKNDRVRRITPPAAVIAALREHKRRMSAERLQVGTGYVFTTGPGHGGQGGTPIEPRNLVRWYKAALQRAGLPDIRFHDLRHSVATMLLEAGVHPRVVMEVLGHSQIAITMDTYSHVMPHVQREALDRMEDVLFGS